LRAAVAAISASALVVTMLAACSSSSSSGGSSTAAGGASSAAGGGSSASKGKSPKDVHLAFIYDTTDSNFAQEMSLGAAAAASATGIQLDNTAPPTADGTDQVKLFNAAEQTSKDGIAMATLFPDLFVRPWTDAHSAGIPEIAVDTPPPTGAPVTFFIGNDNFQLGVQLANEMLPKIPDSAGQILIGTDTPGLPVLTQRNNGFISVIKSQRPKITFLQFNSMQSPTANYSSWSSAVAAHPNALAYVGPGSQDAVSLSQIQQKTGKHLLVGACDLDPIALQGVKNGYVEALVSPEHWLKGYLAIALLAQLATKGTPLPSGWWNPGDLVVNSANIDQILARQATPAARTAFFQQEVTAELADPSKYLKPLSAIE
jgi:ribose transport system substrate-binding protein